MPRPVSMWRDERGFLHDTEDAARNADAAFERDERRAVVHSMLVRQVQAARAEHVFDCSSATADWLIAQWPTIKVVGFAFRLDDFASGEAEMSQASRVG